MQEWENRKGFTIVELLIVVVVIAILAAITIVAFNGIQNRAKVAATQSAANQTKKKMLTYMIANSDTIPTSLAALGLVDSGDTTYKYVYDTTVSPNIYCISTTVGQLSYATSNKSTDSVAGQCINNRILNPSFETNTASWINAGAGGTVLTRVTAESYSGTASLQVATNGAASLQGAFTTGRASVLPNTTYTASIWIKSEVGRGIRIEFGEIEGVSTVVGRSNSPTVTGDGTWQRHTVTRAMGATANAADIVVRNITAPAHTFYLDGAMISEGTEQLVFGDGNSNGWSWSGAANNTTSLGPSVIQP